MKVMVSVIAFDSSQASPERAAYSRHKWCLHIIAYCVANDKRDQG
jgi:hypothetical protein